MITKIDHTIKYGKQHSGFGVQILYPGLIRKELNDSGFSTLGRIDHARINPGTLIPMHPHQDDEILTYLRSGRVEHRDSAGFSHMISKETMMMMNAGGKFSHEELVLEDGGVLEGLQIFIRPESGGLLPKVQFHQLSQSYSINHWRKLAGRGVDYPLQIRSQTWVMDMRLETGRETLLPEEPDSNTAFLFYVFTGEVQVNENMLLSAGESVLIEGEQPFFRAMKTSDLVLFITQTNAVHFDVGMYSGNLK